MAKKVSKWFRIGVEGDTCDGRVISGDDIQDMADTFDPRVHEAVMHIQAELAPGTTDTTVVQVMQPGYKIGDRVVRAALVAVADPH